MIFDCADCFFKLMASLGVVSFTLNSSIFTVLIYYRRVLLKSNDYKLLCSMIVADMFVGVFCILYGALLYTKEEAVTYKLSAIIPMFSTMFASIASIAGITVNRLIAVNKPLRYHSIMTSKRLMMSFVLIWLVPFCVYTVQVVVYMTCTGKFELEVRSVITVVFFITGSLALGISNCVLYIAIRKQIRLINAHALLTVKLQQLQYVPENEEHASELGYQHTNGKLSSNDKTKNTDRKFDNIGFGNDRTANATRTFDNIGIGSDRRENATRAFDNIGFDSGKNDSFSGIPERNNIATNRKSSVTRQDSNNTDISYLNGDEDKAGPVLPSSVKTIKTKEQELGYSANGDFIRSRWSLSKRDSEATSFSSSIDVPQSSEDCGATRTDVYALADHPLALVSPHSGQETQQIEDIVSKRLPENQRIRKARWSLRAKAVSKKRIRLAKNVTTIVGRLQVDRKKRNKARRENLHMAHMCILVVFAFIVCWLPLSIYRLRYVLGMEPIVWLRRFALFLAAGNSLVNPFIYLLKQKKLRRCIKMAVLGRKSASRDVAS